MFCPEAWTAVLNSWIKAWISGSSNRLSTSASISSWASAETSRSGNQGRGSSASPGLGSVLVSITFRVGGGVSGRSAERFAVGVTPASIVLAGGVVVAGEASVVVLCPRLTMVLGVALDGKLIDC